jgi:uncharacterized protein YkwD
MALRPSIHRLLAPLALACVAAALPTSASAAGRCANAGLMPTATNGAQVSAATLCLINRERTSRGLRALRSDGRLRRVAESYSREMVRHSFFNHVGHDGSTLRDRIANRTTYLSGMSNWAIGENLYWGSGPRATPAESVDGWMHSSGHRRNVLDRRYRDVGIGIAIGAPEDVDGTPAATYTTDFGTHSDG